MDLQPVHIFLITLGLSIPILGIFAGLAKEWLNLRAKRATPANARALEQKLERLLERTGNQQKALEKANQELKEKVERLEQSRADYAERLENLEAVVVSQAWDDLHKPGAKEAPAPKSAGEERTEGFVGTRPHEVFDPSAEETNRKRAAVLARQLGR